MRAIITVIGKDTVGIIAKVSATLSSHGINVSDISQSVFDDLFAMMMLVDLSGCDLEFSALVSELDSLGKKNGLQIHAMREEIFDTMHRI